MDHLFIDYANLSLSLPNNPMALYLRIDDSFGIDPKPSRKIMRVVMEIKNRNFDGRSSVEKLTEELQAIPEIYDVFSTGRFIDSLPDSFYKPFHMIGNPEVGCTLGYAPRWAYLDSVCVKDGNDIKCYECDQLYFRGILGELAEGKELSQVRGMSDVRSAWQAMTHKELRLDPDSRESPQAEERINVYSLFESLRTLYWNSASYRLIEFLLDSKGGQALLKVCPVCEGFFVANRRNRIYCAERCRRLKAFPPEEWREYMKKHRAKVKRQRDEVHETNREHMIQSRMKGLDLTREQAIEQIDFDDSL